MYICTLCKFSANKLFINSFFGWFPFQVPSLPSQWLSEYRLSFSIQSVNRFSPVLLFEGTEGWNGGWDLKAEGGREWNGRWIGSVRRHLKQLLAHAKLICLGRVIKEPLSYRNKERLQRILYKGSFWNSSPFRNQSFSSQHDRRIVVLLSMMRLFQIILIGLSLSKNAISQSAMNPSTPVSMLTTAITVYATPTWIPGSEQPEPSSAETNEASESDGVLVIWIPSLATNSTVHKTHVLENIWDLQYETYERNHQTKLNFHTYTRLRIQCDHTPSWRLPVKPESKGSILLISTLPRYLGSTRRINLSEKLWSIWSVVKKQFKICSPTTTLKPFKDGTSDVSINARQPNMKIDT